ncbi:MAG: amidohydrolase family protein, partial [Firmicutes bacterium]|nr:amidohydrolase family protein [Bacillota bacterium]
MKVYKGNILTVNEKDEEFQFLVEDGGRIVFVGDTLPGEFLKAPMEELGDKALIPAFCDTHQHFASFSIFNAGLNVADADSNEQIIKMAKDFYLRSKSKTLVAFGASPYSVKERRLLSREELDSVCPDKPFFMVKYDGHACVVNSVLLEKVRDACKDLRGYHPDTGEMNQEAFFAVSDYITNSVAIPELVKSMQKAVDFEAGRGIGMVHTVSGVGFPGDLDISLEKWFAKSVKSGFQIRVFPQSMDISAATKRKLPRIGGCF